MYRVLFKVNFIPIFLYDDLWLQKTIDPILVDSIDSEAVVKVLWTSAEIDVEFQKTVADFYLM